MDLTDFVDGLDRPPDLEKRRALMKACRDVYSRIGEGIEITWNKRFASLVCPARSDRLMFDRWFNLKEAYSSLLVNRLMKRFGVEPGGWIFEPFLGSGTTLVAAMRSGVNGVGIEVNPFLHLLSRTKVAGHDLKEIKEKARELIRWSRSLEPEKRDGITSAFDGEFTMASKLFGDQLSIVDDVSSKIRNTYFDSSGPTRDFLLTGLGCVLESVSTAIKDGNGLKYPAGKVPERLVPALERQYRLMMNDLKLWSDRSRSEGIDKTILTAINADSRNVNINGYPGLEEREGTFSCSIFSPPYANCFDYTEVYKIELWMLGFASSYDDMNDLRERSLSSHLRKKYGNDVKTVVPGLDEIVALIEPCNDSYTTGKRRRLEKTREMLGAYFNDMKMVLDKVGKLLSHGGNVACIVGNSAYDGIPVATDLFLASILRKMGYVDLKVEVARKLGTSSQQSRMLRENPYLRESIVMGTKN
jgi:hypothetical protein